MLPGMRIPLSRLTVKKLVPRFSRVSPRGSERPNQYVFRWWIQKGNNKDHGNKGGWNEIMKLANIPDGTRNGMEDKSRNLLVFAAREWNKMAQEDSK